LAETRLLFKGKHKHLFTAEKEDQIIMKFVDSESNFDGDPKAKFKNKAVLRSGISDAIFAYLDGYNIPTHMAKRISETEISVKKLQMLPIVVVIRNIIAGSLAKRFNKEKGIMLKYPVLEYYLNDENLGHQLITESHAYAFDYATPEEMKHIARLSLKVNAVLKAFLERRNLKLIDYKLEFGRYRKQICLGDEITPDTCRIWAVKDGKIDAKYFAFNDGKAKKAYQEIFDRLVLNKG
jgi:phosphoribosylaminoimidazole-succinocarboxamide synthase